MSSNFVAEIPGKEFFNSHNCSPKLSRSGCTYLGLAMVPSSTTWQSVPTSSESGAVERTSVFFICAINFARRNFAEPLKFTWDQSSGRSDHVSGPYIARDLGKFLCIGQFPAKIKSANEAEYLDQRHALLAQAPCHARLHTITHDLGAPSSANVCGREKKKPPRNWRGLIPSRRPRWLSGEIFVRSGSWFRAQFGWIAVDVR